MSRFLRHRTPALFFCSKLTSMKYIFLHNPGHGTIAEPEYYLTNELVGDNYTTFKLSFPEPGKIRLIPSMVKVPVHQMFDRVVVFIATDMTQLTMFFQSQKIMIDLGSLIDQGENINFFKLLENTVKSKIIKLNQ